MFLMFYAPREKIEKIHMSIDLDDLINCLHKEYTFKYSKIVHKIKFEELVNSI
jgi:hypothetical protein